MSAPFSHESLKPFSPLTCQRILHEHLNDLKGVI